MNYVRGARVGLGMTGQEVADYLGMSLPTYRNRESNYRGKFTVDQKVKLAKLFGWSPAQMNEYLFDGKLPISEQNTWQ